MPNKRSNVWPSVCKICRRLSTCQASFIGWSGRTNNASVVISSCRPVENDYHKQCGYLQGEMVPRQNQSWGGTRLFDQRSVTIDSECTFIWHCLSLGWTHPESKWWFSNTWECQNTWSIHFIRPIKRSTQTLAARWSRRSCKSREIVHSSMDYCSFAL